MFQNSNREIEVILLMISNGEGWHYLAVKKLSAFLRGIMSKRHGYFCCLNGFHSFRRKCEPKSQKIVCENTDFCNFVMLSGDTKKLEFN